MSNIKTTTIPRIIRSLDEIEDRRHSLLTEINPDDHHVKTTDLAELTNRPHNLLTGLDADDHPQYLLAAKKLFYPDSDPNKTTLKASDDAEFKTAETDFVTAKSRTVPRSYVEQGAVTVYYELRKASEGTAKAYSRVLVDGVEKANAETAETVYVEVVHDIPVAPGSKIVLQIRTDNVNIGAHTRNFRIYCVDVSIDPSDEVVW